MAVRLEQVTYTVPTEARPLLGGGVSLRVAQGSFCGIIGPSGAGKTTLLRVLSGRATEGTLAGRVSAPFSRTSFVPQHTRSCPHLTVRETLSFAVVLSGRAASEVDRVLELLRLTPCANRRVGVPDGIGISGGERKRLSMAVYVLGAPAVLLVDEPTSGLDSGSATEVLAILRTLTREKASTVVATLHQPRPDMLAALDWLVVLHRGVVAYDLSLRIPRWGNPADVLLDWLLAKDRLAFDHEPRVPVVHLDGLHSTDFAGIARVYPTSGFV